jgi:hypothetical protein
MQKPIDRTRQAWWPGVNCKNGCAGRPQRGLERVGIHRGIGVEVDRAALRRRLADGAHVFDRMHARELLVGGERRVKSRQVLAEARGDQLVLDRAEPRGPLGMVRAHLVLEAIGMRDEGSIHA